MLCLYYPYIHSYLNYANTAWCSTNRTYLKKPQSQQKHAIRIIFHEYKSAQTTEHFKENNILNIYQLNFSITFFSYMDSKMESLMFFSLILKAFASLPNQFPSK